MSREPTLLAYNVVEVKCTANTPRFFGRVVFGPNIDAAAEVAAASCEPDRLVVAVIQVDQWADVLAQVA